MNVVAMKPRSEPSAERWLDRHELSEALREMGFRVGPRKLLALAKHGLPSEYQFRTKMFLLSEALTWLEAEGHITRRTR